MDGWMDGWMDIFEKRNSSPEEDTLPLLPDLKGGDTTHLGKAPSLHGAERQEDILIGLEMASRGTCSENLPLSVSFHLLAFPPWAELRSLQLLSSLLSFLHNVIFLCGGGHNLETGMLSRRSV